MSTDVSSPATTPASASDEKLTVVMVGHVDHGKSTLLGRLFHDAGQLPEGKLEELQKAAERRHMPFEWANLVDALQAERDQNITIETTQIWFRTPKRSYVFIDAPGHQEFLRNMVTGAAQADAAFLLIDAREGARENTRRHGYLLHLLGIRQIVGLVNKMDLADYSPDRFHQIVTECRAWLATIGLDPTVFIPISAKHGDNLASRSAHMPWWQGPTVLDSLDHFTLPVSLDALPLRFPIQDVYRFDERRILAGRVESGRLKIGDRLVFVPSNQVSTVGTIERWNAPMSSEAVAGECVGITLTLPVFAERGDVAAHESSPPYVLRMFKARVFWLGRQPLVKGRSYKLKLVTQEVDCEIESIDRIIDVASLDIRWALPGFVQADHVPILSTREVERVDRHEIAELSLRTRRPIAFDVSAEIAPTGRFVIVDGLDVAGGGVILADHYPRRTADSLHKSKNIYWNRGKITTQQRALRLGHLGRVLWLTGLSGAGKSTIAAELERELFAQGQHAYVLDGDNIRHGLNRDLGFSPEDRKENIRRIGEVAKLLVDAGLICITAFISPYRADRALVRSLVAEGQFIEVFVNAPLEVCEQRDNKGLYARARAGEIKEFTGISAPYETPLHPELELRTDELSVAQAVERILEYLRHLDAGHPVSLSP
jgi:bifunctional enzyme CysN/CysC